MVKHRTLRRFAGAALAAAMTAGIMLATPSPALASTHERVQNYNSHLAAHVNDRVAGHAVEQQPYASSTKEQWNRIAVSGNQVYVFQNWYSGLCMDVGGVPLSEAPIVQVTCNLNNARQWWILVQDPDDPVVQIMNWITGYCLAVENLSTVAGAALVQLRCSSISPADKWQIW